ncbi:AMP-dependent synthetase/ligase [Arenicella xantha]|uniref:Long-chain acyl-CoA synthetase n=1 Tax=Arenicella xantha TaxID=644221 RepID=A0A395JS29_9GAMM|nr:long-chain fatty acid--CoA ligase [Arenicella xantha]RBP53142.1 long-chain acyl-CoA synthetase [Arenicella xantha]
MPHTEPKIYVQHPDDALVNDTALDVINCHDATTLDQLFRERVRRSSNKVAYRYYQDKQWQSITWAGLASEVERWQVAFREAGLQKSDRVAICYRNSVEWVVFDQAALRLGLVVVPLYTQDRADNIAYVIGNAGAKIVLFADTEIWLQVLDTDEDTSCVERVLVMRGAELGKVKLVDNWLPEHGRHFERGLAKADDLASIVYTSGTTGRPKGVMLSHRNMLSNAYSGMRSVPLHPDDCLLSFLPLSHTLERTVGYYAAMMSASEVAFNRSIPELADDLREIKPTVMISVPRIFERVHNKIYAGLAEQSSFKRWLFQAAVRVGWARFQTQQGIRSWSLSQLLHPLLDALVANTIRSKLGGRLRFVIVGGAPLSETVAKTFISMGVPLLQGYGLTESSPVVSVNTPSRNRPDSIGMLLRGVAAKLMDGDELWVRGENVMMGYWDNPSATSETLVVDGDQRWLRTGDCASIDDDGFLRITGRIKDILVLANGEKVPPSDIEGAISRDPIFEQVLVVGEGKSFLSALVYLNPKLYQALCDTHGQNVADAPSVSVQDDLLARIAQQMDDFPGYAKIRKVALSDQEWTVESGLLTPTLKIKRPKVLAQYQSKIDELYAGHGVHGE